MNWKETVLFQNFPTQQVSGIALKICVDCSPHLLCYHNHLLTNDMQMQTLPTDTTNGFGSQRVAL